MADKGNQDKRLFHIVYYDPKRFGSTVLMSIADSFIVAYHDSTMHLPGADASLYEIRRGSIWIDIMATGGALVAVATGGSAILDFYARLREEFERTSTPKDDASLSLARAAREISKPVADGTASRVEILLDGSNEPPIIIRQPKAVEFHPTNVNNDEWKTIRPYWTHAGWFAHTDTNEHTMLKLFLSKEESTKLKAGRPVRIRTRKPDSEILQGIFIEEVSSDEI